MTSLVRCLQSLIFGAAAALLVGGGTRPARAQDRTVQVGRAQTRVDELFRFRVNLLLEDLGRETELSEPALARARERLHAATDAFCAQHPAKVQDTGPISWSATPIEYQPFGTLLDTEEWNVALDEALEPAARELLASRQAERRDRLRSSLIRVMDSKVARGLCLTPEERGKLGEVLERAADEQLEDGVVQTDNAFVFFVGGKQPGDPFLGMMEDADLAEALEGPRRELFEQMVKTGYRSALLDYQLEIEFLLYGRDDCERERRLMRGGALAMTQRDGDEPQRMSASLFPTKSSTKDKFWDRLVAGVLGLGEGEELPALPSRSRDELMERRADYLLAILDERACFSSEQREGLLPLMREFVEAESTGRARGGDFELLLPASFGVSQEGLLVGGENVHNQPSTKVKALIKTFYETCTQDQRDVLES